MAKFKLEDQRPYHYCVSVGDIVRLPSGALGEVKFVQVVFKDGEMKRGNARKVVFIEPNVVWWLRWILWFSGQLWYCDKEINKLLLIKKEIKNEAL